MTRSNLPRTREPYREAYAYPVGPVPLLRGRVSDFYNGC